MSEPLPINAAVISGYIVLGTKKLNIHLTLEDVDSGSPDNGQIREGSSTEDGLHEQDEDDSELRGQDRDDGEGESELTDQDDDEDDTELTDQDQAAKAAAAGNLRNLLRPRPRRSRQDGGREETANPTREGRGRTAGRDEQPPTPRGQRGDSTKSSSRSSAPTGAPSAASGRSRSAKGTARSAGTSPEGEQTQTGQPSRRTKGGRTAKPSR
ncbi:MAG: hypothetical protein QOJ30_2813 [Pseudonocardiales bacterium]|nr:hypothetical protein [Pseudonocardiales bacterium]